MSNANPSADQSQLPQPGLRTFISLVLFIHLFGLFAGLSANFERSNLQGNLMRVLRPYTQTLHLDPNFTPFYLAPRFDYDFPATIALHRGRTPEAIATFPSEDDSWLQAARIRRLNRVFAFHALQENDAGSGELARMFGRSVLGSNADDLKSIHVVLNRDPPQYVSPPGERLEGPDQLPAAELYRGEVTIARDGKFGVVKLSEARQAATKVDAPNPPSSGTPNATPKPNAPNPVVPNSVLPGPVGPTSFTPALPGSALPGPVLPSPANSPTLPAQGPQP